MKKIAIAVSVLSGLLFVAATDYAALDYAAHVTVAGALALIAANLAVVGGVLFVYLDFRPDSQEERSEGGTGA